MDVEDEADELRDEWEWCFASLKARMVSNSAFSGNGTALISANFSIPLNVVDVLQ